METEQKPEQLVTYISFSAMSLYEKDPAAYYKRYMVKPRPPREPQSRAMAAGSSFDALVKADLYARFIGDGDPKYDAQTLFEAQVEPHCRDEALPVGQELLRLYKVHGAYGELTRLMRGCMNLRMETELTSRVEGVDLLGKPDLQFVSKDGARVVLDWKVQGRYSNQPKSPNPGYVCLYPGGAVYKDVIFRDVNGIKVSSKPFERHCEEWAEQLSIYAWSMGENVGDETVFLVDQFACDMHKGTARVARHAGVCSEEWQREWMDRIKAAWRAIQTGHLFQAMSREDNDAKIAQLQEDIDFEKSLPDTFRKMTSPAGRTW